MKATDPSPLGRKDACVLFYVKYPEEGRVKTRIAETLGVERAAELYRHLVVDMLGVLAGAETPLFLCYAPAGAKRQLVRWLGKDYRYVPQRGGDLGERMRNSFMYAFSHGYGRAVLAGSDIPELSLPLVRQALEALSGSDAVLGPAADGGYYLIGFRREGFCLEVFDGMRWGSDRVLADTRKVLQGSGKSCALLPELNDVDTMEDLVKYYRRAAGTARESSGAYRFLQGLFGSAGVAPGGPRKT